MSRFTYELPIRLMIGDHAAEVGTISLGNGDDLTDVLPDMLHGLAESIASGEEVPEP